LLVAVVVFVVPLSLRAGMWVGTLSAHMVQAVVPALLVFAVLPPLAVMGAERAWRLRLGEVSTRLGVRLGLAVGAQVLVLVGAIGLGASARRLGDTVVLTLVEALVLPAVVMGMKERGQK
jgi:hypothetical protein